MNKKTVKGVWLIALVLILAGLMVIILSYSSIRERRNASLNGVIVTTEKGVEPSHRGYTVYTYKDSDGATLVYTANVGMPELQNLSVGDRINKEVGDLNYTVNGQSLHLSITEPLILTVYGGFLFLCGLITAVIAVIRFNK